MDAVRHVRLFRNGRNQAVRIPKESELEGNQAIIRKDGDRLILVPIGGENRLMALLKTLPAIDEVFPEIEDLPAMGEKIF